LMRGHVDVIFPTADPAPGEIRAGRRNPFHRWNVGNWRGTSLSKL
jgi:hypothetical protein